MTDQPQKTSKKIMKNQEPKKASISPKAQTSSGRKSHRKGENPVRIPPSSEESPDFGNSNSWLCKNAACRATLSIDDTFCKRCSCCICHLFDDNKDPSLWLVCSSESGTEDSCGLSCHIECALQREKVGVVDLGQLMQLDGSYCCASCGKVSGILGCWKKQLNIAKDARRVDVLCYRIFLSYRLLEGSSRFKELHEIVRDAKAKLEKEVGPVNGVSAKMARGIVSRLPVAGEVQKLCSLAIDKADEWLAAVSNKNPTCRGLLSPEKFFQLSTGNSSVQSLRHVRPIWAAIKAASVEVSTREPTSDVLKALSQIIDPDFGTDIVSCGFVKDLHVNEASGEVSFRLELTTPACPVKDMFEQRANEVVTALPWVKGVNVTMSAQPARPVFAGLLPPGLQTISNIVAVSSCKGGVGKSTVAVNLAYTLAGMGARVGIFDADVYGPSLPTMVSPESRLLEMNPVKKTIIPTEYLGVKLVSFGFAGQGRAIMRGPMVSGVINQLLTTTEWGELDYLVIDMPPGTGDIQLTLCQVVPLTAAVIVTTPQKLAFIDVAKGVRMFSKLKVPCVAVVENMCHFDADGKRYYPFGRGSGSQVIEQFGIPHLFDLPIRPTLSASGDSGTPEVVADPQGEVAKTFQDLGVCVVQQCAKIRQQVSTAVTYDKSIKAIKVKVPDSDEEFLLHPATVRRNDRSAQSVDEWSGEQKLQYTDVPEDIEPEEIRPMGNYAVSITWPDGFSQIAPYDQLQTMERLIDVPQPTPA